jgi:hypothetical protein
VTSDERLQQIGETLKLACATLRDAEIPYALGGSFAAWARGGPTPENDLDLMVKPGDAERALQALAKAGMRPEKPPEEWLFKAWHDEVMIDLIFLPAGMEMTDEVIARAEPTSVMAIEIPVMAIEDVLATKLHALREHSLDYSALLGIARALREQIDWRELHSRVRGSPYAEAFFTLVRELGILPGSRASSSPGARVRVMPPARSGSKAG